MATEFFKMLCTNPANIGSTRGVMELVLLGDTVSAISEFLWGKVMTFLPEFLSPYTAFIYKTISSYYTYLLHGIGNGFTWL
jgi:hypothetical protein